MGHFLTLKFDLLGSIRDTRKQENQLQNHLMASWLPPMSLSVYAFMKIWVDFATFSGLTKTAITASNLDGFSIFKVLQLDVIQDHRLRCQK